MSTVSKKLNCVVIDDEPLAAGLLADYISRIPFLELVDVYHDSLMAIAALKSKTYDLLFLDIRMPGLSGLKLSQLIDAGAKIIFTTAYPSYAVEGFELNAVDYLLKPISFDRFLKAATRALEIIRSANIPVSESSGTAPVLSSLTDVIFVKTDYQIVKVFLSDILYIEGLKEYIAIHTTGKKIITLQNLKKMEEALPSNLFIRVHKSFIVSINMIDTITRSQVIIKNVSIPVGDTYKESFISMLNNKNML